MNVGDYVRTKQGYIRQIREIYDHILYYVNLDKSITMERYGKFEPITQLDRDTIDEIIKSSPNIIDLIEVGDYVNGCRITSVYDDDSDANENNLKHKKCLGKNIYDEDYQEYLIYEEDIKSIVTKEQFEKMEYRIGVDKE